MPTIIPQRPGKGLASPSNICRVQTDGGQKQDASSKVLFLSLSRCGPMDIIVFESLMVAGGFRCSPVVARESCATAKGIRSQVGESDRTHIVCGPPVECLSLVASPLPVGQLHRYMVVLITSLECLAGLCDRLAESRSRMAPIFRIV